MTDLNTLAENLRASLQLAASLTDKTLITALCNLTTPRMPDEQGVRLFKLLIAKEEAANNARHYADNLKPAQQAKVNAIDAQIAAILGTPSAPRLFPPIQQEAAAEEEPGPADEN